MGNAPSVAKEMIDLNPVNLGSVLLKKTNYLGKLRPNIYGNYEIEPCDEEDDAEHFLFGGESNEDASLFSDMFFVMFLVITLVICGGFLYVYYNNGKLRL